MTNARDKEIQLAPVGDDTLTGPVEDYLKAIYALGRGSDAVATNDIAQRLMIAPASVSGMVRRLAEQGLLSYERYHGVRLTDRGRRAALRTLRRHRVIESYLSKALAYPWDRVHAEAERLEHAASDELIDRMAEAIGEPAVDPHGAPIPSREGVVDETEYFPLVQLGAGLGVRVVRVTDDDAEMLRYLAELEITPGTEILIVSKAPFDGPITLRIGKELHSIGPALASQIMVEPIVDLEAPAH
ncbi:MAG TPA: metal-dependent transcriptional regulator [Gemmatimonadaceae bacterium]|jgi:DtxR family Mn-dependent transcriptional regulator|nr:metal-dependent transcriptional regulator [Gemmatimonadaceae bacterium]